MRAVAQRLSCLASRAKGKEKEEEKTRDIKRKEKNKREKDKGMKGKEKRQRYMKKKKKKETEHKFFYSVLCINSCKLRKTRACVRTGFFLSFLFASFCVFRFNDCPDASD